MKNNNPKDRTITILTASNFGVKDGKCRFDASNVGATDTGFVDVEHGSESALKKAVAKVGPISVAIDASQPSFQFYHDGNGSHSHRQILMSSSGDRSSVFDLSKSIFLV